MSESKIVVHGTALSGHTHRVELLLSMLEIPYRRIDTPAEVRRSPEFLATRRERLLGKPDREAERWISRSAFRSDPPSSSLQD